jgi:hypothetical protein
LGALPPRLETPQAWPRTEGHFNFNSQQVVGMASITPKKVAATDANRTQTQSRELEEGFSDDAQSTEAEADVWLPPRDSNPDMLIQGQATLDFPLFLDVPRSLKYLAVECDQNKTVISAVFGYCPAEITNQLGSCARNPPSFAIALNCGTGSSFLKALVKAFEKFHIVLAANSGYCGSKYSLWTRAAGSWALPTCHL